MGWRLRLSDKTVRKLAELPIYCQRQKCSPWNVVSACVRFMQVLAPILFLLYTADLIKLVKVRDLHPHLYTDDTQLYGFCSPDRALALQERVTESISDVAAWMRSDRLQLNAAKTEVLWCASGRRQRQLPDAPFTVGSDTVKPVRCVRDLGIYLDSDVSMRINSCLEDGHQLFRLTASDQKYSTLSKQTSAAVTGHVTNSLKA